MFAHDKKEKKQNRKLDSLMMLKKPVEASMLHTIDGETFHSFMKNSWIVDLGASCHIINDDTGLYDVIDINKLV